LLTKEEIRSSYKSFDDNKILKLAQNPKGLTKEAIPVLIEEVILRKLDVNLIEWIQLENNPLNQLEKDSILSNIRNCKCTICKKNSDLKAYEFHSVISGILFCDDILQHLIICEKCNKKIRRKNFFNTLLLGWWSRKGFVSTISALLTEFFNLFLVKKVNDRILNTLIEENNGKLRLILKSKNPKEETQYFIEIFNQKNLKRNEYEKFPNP